MANVHDVAAFILRALGPMTTKKLQKLVYYSQAWSVAWDGCPLFSSPIEAWKDGPVVRDLFDRHRGAYEVRVWPVGQADRLTAPQQATIKGVLRFYGRMDPEKLGELTHREKPWRLARRGLPLDEASDNVIGIDDIRKYYGSVPRGASKRIPDEFRRGVELLLATPERELEALFEPDPVDGEDVLRWLEEDGDDPWARASSG